MRHLLALLFALAACSLRPYEFGASATSSTGAATSTTTTALPTTSTISGVTTTTTEPGTSTSGTTITIGDTTIAPPVPDLGGAAECGPWMQECPEGQKCMPYSSDGDHAWESWHCVDIVRNPAGIGQPCVYGDIATGEDSCDVGLMCWDTDPNTGEGTCIAMCGGTPDAPTCPDPWISCLITADATLILCLPMCNPLAQDCGNGDLCLPNPYDATKFICVLDASGDEGQTFDLCEYANACDPGLYCATPDLAAECDPMVIGCCLPFCDVTQPNTCPGQGLECVPWYEQGAAPPGFEVVGVCRLPLP